MIGEKKNSARVGEKADSYSMGVGSKMGSNAQSLDVAAPVEMTKIVADKK